MVKPFFSFSQSAPTVSVSRARETISRKKEEKVKLIFISASIGHSFELACLRGLFLQFCTTCSLLRSRRSTLEMCFLGLPGEHICLNIVFLMSCQTWVQIATNREEGSGKSQSAAGETGVTSCITFQSIQRCISASWKELKITLDSLRLVTWDIGFHSSEMQAKLLVEPINSSHIERKLLDTYPGVSKVLDDSQDENPLDRCSPLIAGPTQRSC